MSVAPVLAPGGFQKFVDAHPSLHDELPLVHTMLCEQFISSTLNHQLNPEACDVFGEPLVYLFYGRPAYRSLRGHKPATSFALCPVCLVFKPHRITHLIHRMYPLDTGALNGGMFEPHIPRDHLGRYELKAVIESARRYTHMYFDTNRQYFLAAVRPSMSLPPSQPESRAIHSLLTLDGEAAFDDRRSAVEIQVGQSIPLKDLLLAVLLPTTFLESPGIRQTLVKEWGAYPLTYSVTRGVSPAEYYGVIRDRLERYLSEGGYL